MIDYVIEYEVPDLHGGTRWVQLGPTTGNLQAVTAVYEALEARGDRVQLVAYGPRVLRSYVDKLPVEPEEPGKVLPGLKALMERPPPWNAFAAPSLIRTEPDGRVVLPTAQEILDRVNAEGITPEDNDAVAKAFPVEDEHELSDKQKTLYEAAGLIPHTNVLGEPVVKGQAEENSGPEAPATQELPALAVPEDERPGELAEAPAPEIPEAAPEPQLRPGDPGFLEQFQRQHAMQVIHRHADGTRTTRSAQALNT